MIHRLVQTIVWPSPINCSPSPYLPIITIRRNAKSQVTSFCGIVHHVPRLPAQATRTLDHPQVSHSMSGTSRQDKIASFVGRTQEWGYAMIPLLALRNEMNQKLKARKNPKICTQSKQRDFMTPWNVLEMSFHTHEMRHSCDLSSLQSGRLFVGPLRFGQFNGIRKIYAARVEHFLSDCPVTF